MALSKDYKSKILPVVQEKLGLKNIHEVPSIQKITVNIGIGSYVAKKDKDYAPMADRLKAITGQTPVLVKSAKAISNFKLRKGMPNGLKVTLRGKRMMEFLDRLITIVLPRTRDFRGVSRKAFDKAGNYSLGVKEITIFPEAQIDDLTKVHGLQINISTSAKDASGARVLLEEIGIPFAK